MLKCIFGVSAMYIVYNEEVCIIIATQTNVFSSIPKAETYDNDTQSATASFSNTAEIFTIKGITKGSVFTVPSLCLTDASKPVS